MFKPFITRIRKTPLLQRVFKRPTLSSLNPRNWRRKITWRTVLKVGIIGLGVFIIASIALFAWYFKDLPKPGELRARSASESTILYDRNGKQIYDISGDERRILLTSNEIPKNVKNSVVALEDHNFYHHHGVDYRGIIRGVILRPLTGRGFQGGSTITQQYVKNAVVGPKRSPIRKIKEIIVSTELEFVYKKDDILTLYLNEIPFGSNIYGVEAASQTFFGHSAKDGLSIPEAATLASIIQAPTRYSPYGNHVDALMTRKNLTIDNMVKYGYITADEGKTAKTQAPLVAKDFAQPRSNFPAPHFVMYVREQLVSKYGEDLVQSGGLRVTTTLDLDLQSKADSAVKEQAKTLAKAKASNTGLVAIDPKTGQLLAMVGSVDYFDRDHEGNFNVATANRQPGSAGKPIVYSTLFSGQYSPASALWDVQTDFNGYKPNNFDGNFRGPVTIRSAIGNSLNIPAVKALSLEGINNFINTATDMGITTLKNRKDAGLSLALGGGEVKLVDLTAAYGVLANGGERQPITSILKIQDSKGKILNEWKATPKQVIKPEIAFEVSDMLADTNAKKPTFTRLLSVLSVSGKTVAVKTGTTNSYKDAWTIGYTPSLVAGVWAGNNNGDEMDHGGGSTVAAPVWHAFMAKALEGKQDEQFKKPDDVTKHTVDFLSGKNPTGASGQLVEDWFAPWQLPTKDDDVHQSVKVCKSNGQLATDVTPPDEIEDRTYTTVHSEQPNNPAWEGPVQSWAKGAGLVTDAPPTQKCDITFRDPKVSFSSPGIGDTVSGIFTASVIVTFPPGASGTVDFGLDGKTVATDTSAPFAATIDASGLPTGTHTLTATAHSDSGTSSTSSESIIIGADSIGPHEATGVTVVPQTSGKAKVTWTNPSDSDLDGVSFYVSQASGIQGARNSTVSAHPADTQSTVLNGLVSGVTNYITVVPIDKSGNPATTTKQYTVTPL